MTDELWEVMRRHHPNAVRLGGVCYVRLEGGNLAKAECIASGGYYDGLRLTILNPYFGPVDSLTLRSWELSRRKHRSDPGRRGSEPWDVYRPEPDIDAFSETAEEYLNLFRKPDVEKR